MGNVITVLNDQHRQAAELLAKGESMLSVAGRLGVHIETIRRWREHPLFAEYLARYLENLELIRRNRWFAPLDALREAIIREMERQKGLPQDSADRIPLADLVSAAKELQKMENADIGGRPITTPKREGTAAPVSQRLLKEMDKLVEAERTAPEVEVVG